MILPFYAGQKVALALEWDDTFRYFKHGVVYTISECVSKINPANGLGPFVYVGIVGHCNGGSYFTPKLFVPVEYFEASIMTFEKIQDSEPIEILINN